MGTQQTCLSSVLPPVGVPQFFVEELEGKPARNPFHASGPSDSEGTIPEHPHGEEWAVVQQAIAGDAAAERHLFTRHSGKLYRVAFALLRNKEDAEDAVQDALCRAYNNLRSFQGRSSFATWLTRIVVNSALMSRRRKSAHTETELLPEEVADVRPDPEERCVAHEIRVLIEKHVSQLPVSLRAALRLSAIDGLSVAEASRALGISVSTFKSRTFRARRKLASVLEQSRLRLAGEPV